MTELLYSDFVSYIKKYHLKNRFDAVSFCMGYCGKLDNEHFDMIEKMFINGIIEA